MSRPHAAQMGEYFDELVKRCQDDHVDPLKVNANMLAGMGGSRARREEAVKLFLAIFVDENGTLIAVPDEVNEWIDTMTLKLFEVKALALGAARFQTAQMLEDTKAKLAQKTAEHVQTSEQLVESVENVDQLELEVAELKLQLEQAAERELALNDSLTEKSRELSQRQSELTESESQNRYLQLQLDTAVQKSEQLESQLKLEKDLSASYKDSLADLKVRHEDLKKSFAQQATELKSANEDLGNTEKTLAGVRVELGDATQSVRELKKEKSSLETEISKEKGLCGELRDQLKQQQEQAEQAQSKLLDQIDRKSKSLEKAEKKLSETEGELKAAGATIMALESVIEPLKASGALSPNKD